ncbi:MAG: GNAT family N-acetyltransferase [Chloroflexales bacterium]|nr:GNAT family N-acetyltransferase [Chloroflexales bacterium]
MSAKSDSVLNHANLSLHRARVTDFGVLQALLDDSAATLRVRYGIGPWGIATTARQMERNMTRHHIMLVHYLGVAVATFTFAPTTPSWYPTNVFTPTAKPVGYLTNLCVLPSFQGQGVGLWCAGKAAELGHTIGYGAIRCDLYADIKPSHHFAHNAGYTWCGDITFASHVRMLCEKLI